DQQQTPAADKQSANSEIEQVLIPVDPQRNPVGSKFFVSERFLRSLYDEQSRDSRRDRQWLLLNASYAGELNESRSQVDGPICSIACTFTIETLARNIEVVLPIVQTEAVWQSPAMLDG